MKRRLARISAGLALLALTGCQTAPLRTMRGMLTGKSAAQAAYTEDDLRSDLAQYAEQFQGAITVASDSITSQTQDPAIRRRALLWKIRLIPLVSTAAYVPDPEHAYAALLTLAVSQDDFLTTGAGANAFGALQDIATETSGLLVQSIVEVGRNFLSDAELARARADVSSLVKEHPIRGDFVPDVARGFIEATAAGGRFDWIVTIPLSPFRALQGVDTGAQAIREINQTAQRFNQILGTLPQLLRWNAELLVYEIETHKSVESGLESFDLVAQSAQALSAAAQTLPADLREQAVLLVQQIDASQGELRKTLESARAVLTDAERTGTTYEPVVASLDRTATQLAQAGVAWKEMVEAVRTPSDDGSKSADSRPFDILDYERTAEQVRAAATEVRGVLDDARGVGDAATGALVDRLAWRGFQLTLAFFALLFVYRRIEAALTRRRL